MDRNSRIQWPNTSLAPTLTAFPKYRGQNNLTSLIGSISETANYICPFKTGCLQRRIARFEMWWTPCFEVMLPYTLVLYDGGDRAFLACQVQFGEGGGQQRIESAGYFLGQPFSTFCYTGRTLEIIFRPQGTPLYKLLYL